MSKFGTLEVPINIGLMHSTISYCHCATFHSFVYLSCIGYYEGVRTYGWIERHFLQLRYFLASGIITSRK